MPINSPMLGAGDQRNAIAQAIMTQQRMGGNPMAGAMPAPPPQSAGGINAQGLPGGGMGGMPQMGMPPAAMGAPPAAPPMPPQGAQAFAAGAGVPPGASPMSSMFNQQQPPPY